MRVFVKGGAWSNVEDEILKLAVAKYGTKRWERIASLLPKKSAKQVKNRWKSWLDPSVKKTEWSREEEEKLLYMAKIMPTQWRTIAPIVGRTAVQCLKKYEQLLAAATQDDDDDSPQTRADKLFSGETDPHPESRPARPDAIDMDEDAKEMLMEARARVVNTKGKKAKRRAREAQLKASRRRVQLQKRREMVAAGLLANNDEEARRQRKLRKKGLIDYAKEVPFEKKVPKGFFAVPKNERPTFQASQLVGRTIDQIEGRDRIEKRRKELKERKKKRQKKLKRAADPKALVKQQQMRDATGGVIQRSALALPAPQMTDGELSAIAASVTADVGSAAAHVMRTGARATSGLISAYATPSVGAMATARAMRTPAAAHGQSSLMAEARDLIALNSAQTPLMGGVNTPLHTRRTVAPSENIMATPNALAQAVAPVMGARDGLAINRATGSLAGAAADDDDDDEHYRRGARPRSLGDMLASLPAPTNTEFEVEMPALPEVTPKTADAHIVPDQADVDAAAAAAAAAEAARLRARRSQPFQQQLPLLATAPPVASADPVWRLVEQEMARLAAHEQALDRGETPEDPWEDLSAADLEAAADALEVAVVEAEEAGTDATGVSLDDPLAVMSLYSTAPAPRMMHDPDSGAVVDATTADSPTRARATRHAIATLNAHLTAAAKPTKKLQKRAQKYLAGYMARAGKAAGECRAICERTHEAERALACHRAIAVQEQVAIASRLEETRKRLEAARERERLLQDDFARMSTLLRQAAVPT